MIGSATVLIAGFPGPIEDDAIRASQIIMVRVNRMNPGGVEQYKNVAVQIARRGNQDSAPR
jgi:hypothetical protein